MVASGDVISESPAAGTNVASGSAVNLVVSTAAGVVVVAATAAVAALTRSLSPRFSVS
jgi:beta-lactam-binding protein with PASTA domain